MDDERYMPVYETCERRGIPIIADTSYWYVNTAGFKEKDDVLGGAALRFLADKA